MGKFDGAKDKYGLGQSFLKARIKHASANTHDSQEKTKSENYKSRNRIDSSRSTLRRARQTSQQEPFVLQLRHTQEHPIHPLWCHLPDDRRTRLALLQLRLRRLRFWLKQRRPSIRIILIGYVGVWTIPLLTGQHLITIFALLPLAMVPPVGYLIYWLVWEEFHA